jgi:hypothetical protein
LPYSRDRFRKSSTNKNGLGSSQKDALKTFQKNKDEIYSDFLRMFFTLFEKPEKGDSKNLSSCFQASIYK